MISFELTSDQFIPGERTRIVILSVSIKLRKHRVFRYFFNKPKVHPSTTRSTAALWCKSILNALLFFALFIFILPWAAHQILSYTLPIPSWTGIWLGEILSIAGTGMWIYSLGVFSQHGRGTPLLFDAPRYLVKTGPFCCIRNPIMFSELLIIWAEVLYFASAGILVYAFTISIIAHLLVIYIEEPELKKRFGLEYEKYCQNVPRWFPGFNRQKIHKKIG